MDTSQKAVGQRLKELRKINRYSGQALGDLVGITRSTISLIESGTNKLSYEYAVTIAKHFGANVEWLMTGEGPMLKGETSGGTSYSLSGNKNTGAVVGHGNQVSGGQGDCEQQLAVAQVRIQSLEEQLRDRDNQITFLKSLLQK